MKKNRMTRGARGFTLLEMMLVLLIIGLLAGVAAWNVVAQGEKSRVRTTRASMQTIAQALEEYQLEKGVFPADLATLVTTQRLKKEPKDAWGNAFVYYNSSSLPGRKFTLYSAGGDGQTGTPDDIVHGEEDTEG